MADGARVALVTGSSRGIGREVCRILAGEGFVVLLSARDGARATAAAEELRAVGGDVRPLTLDVADAAGVTAAAESVGRDPGRLDVLVNNAAAFADWTEVGSTADLAAARAVMETSLFGAWAVSQAFMPLLRAAPAPRLVMVGSGGGSHGDPDFGLAARGGLAATATASPRRRSTPSPPPSPPSFGTRRSSSTPSTPA